MRLLCLSLVLITFGCTTTEKSTLDSILSNGSPTFQSVLKNPKHEVQIIYGKLYRDSIQHFTYNVDPNKFFYPASTVKMPVAFAAMQKLTENAWHLDSELYFDISMFGQ